MALERALRPTEVLPAMSRLMSLEPQARDELGAGSCRGLAGAA